MNDREIKMVALDLDGTTLRDNHEISPRTVAAFKSAMLWISRMQEHQADRKDSRR